METHDVLRAVTGLIFVLGLLLLCAAALRKWGGKLGLIMTPGGNAPRSIKVIESSLLDGRHRLVRVRIENREHVIVLGGASPVVVESKDASP